MKKYLKEMIPTIILAFTASFMLFIYEPIILYSSNMSDFWFDIYTMFSCNIIAFLVCFTSILLIYTFIYFIENILSKGKKNIYYICLLIGFIGFIVTYIQGNYLSKSLPLLDGTTINWNNYTTQMIISAILLFTVSLTVIICTIKFKYEKIIKVLKYLTIVIFAMISVSLVSTCLTKNCFIRKDFLATATTKNINTYSSNKNFIIFLLDAMDSTRTKKIIDENSEYQDIFQDFTYYPDTVSGYVFTRDSIPLILTGNWNENETDFSIFYNDALRNSPLFDMLKENHYDTNIYDEELIYNSNDTDQIKNLSFDTDIDKLSFFKQEIKYVLFKYLPYYLKPYSKIETMDFNGTKTTATLDNRFVWNNTVFYDTYLQENIEITSHNQFKFIHLEGPHAPFDCDANLQPIENGTYEQKVEASLKIINTYLNYLKENNVYNNSAIIIMADHGYEYETEHTIFRQNPIFYVKGINENHDFRTSNEKIGFEDLMKIYENLLNDKSTANLLDDVDTSNPRRILLHETFNYDHMTEYMQQGTSRDYSTSVLTGNTFNLDK